MKTTLHKLFLSGVSLLLFLNLAQMGISQVTYDFSYTGTQQQITLPAGDYRFETWGAQGGLDAGGPATNLGGYSLGEINLTSSTIVYIYVGGQATNINGGFNGGGTGEGIGLGGGGATDIRIGGTGIVDRVIVAAGGGGAGIWNGQQVVGGYGGGSTGGDGYRSTTSNPGGQGATQSGSGNGTCMTFNNPVVSGGLGFGGSAGSCGCNGYGGGGGYFGGAAGGNCRGGGGGSGFVGTLTNSSLLAGNLSMPNSAGGTVVGNSGNGFARIIRLYGASIAETNSIDCNGNSTGKLTATVNGGDAPYTFAWSNGVNSGAVSFDTNSISGLSAGNYTVTVTDNNANTTSKTFSLTEPATLGAATVVDSNTSCNGFSDGGASASATGGMMPYTYAWSNSATNASITGVIAGTYTATITDANGCTSTSSATITEPATLGAATVVDSNTSCNGFSDGGASASATGGTMPYTYAWSNSATNASITGVSAGTYSATITDANGCTSTSSATITQSATIVASAVVDSNISCNGLSDGGATASATGGTSPYTYSWGNGSITTPGITGVSAGLYSVTVLDANGCAGYTDVTLTHPATLSAATSVDSNVTCNGFANGGATGSATGGTTPYTYAWSNAATTASITGIVAGTYSVTITDANGCTSASSSTITQPATLVAASVVNSNITCNGYSNGSATASASGGTTPYTYAWSNAATTANITGVAAGSYTATITDANGCTSTSSATITEPVALMASTVIDSNISCNTFSDGGATASATGGTGAYTYSWNNSATTASITGVSAGLYSVTIIDANGCGGFADATITEPITLVSTASVDSNVTCNGFANGGATASATGGTTPYTYSWGNSATTASITGVTAGSYSVYITDANGCSSGTSTVITEPTALVAATVADSNVTCNGFSDGGATASATGGTAPYAYAWSNSDTIASITGVMAGAYTVTITDTNGCTATHTAPISEPGVLAISTAVDSNVTCFGNANGGVSATVAQTSTLFFEGFESYSGAASYSSNTVLNGLSGASFETSTSQGRVRIPAGPSYVRTGNYSVTLDASLNGAFPDPINYLIKTWNLSSYTNTQLGLDFYVMNHGDEADANDRCWIRGSDTSTWIEIYNFNSPYLSIGSWHHITIDRIDTLITNAGQTLSSTFGIRFGQQDNFKSTSTTASDGFTFDDISITTSSVGSATYAWSNSATTSSLTGINAGTYTVTITNPAGCMAVDSIVVTEPNELIASIAIDSNESCMNTLDGGLTASETGGTSGYSYLWSTGATTANVDMLTAGMYTVTITDANGCTSSANETIIHGLATSATEIYTVCDSVISPSGMYTWTTSGVYMDTLVNAVGCDSVITTNLTVNNSTSSTQVITTCDSYTSPSGFFVWTVSGIYTDLITNAAGCDSTITVDLTITHSTDSTITVNACNSYSGVSGNQNWITSGVYTDVIPNAVGCDSMVTVNLTINNSTMITQNPEICNGDSIQVGSNWYTMEGTYVDTLTTMTGCDSIVTTMLDVETVDVSVTDFNGTLRADNDFASSFQWINCDSNNAVVAGATSQLFTPTVTGNYAVVVNSTNCVDTSDCYFVDLVGIEDLTQNIQIAVYPNPAGADQGTVLIEVANANQYNIVIRDLTGKMVYNQNEVSVMQNEIDITKFAAGTFFIEIQTEQGSTFTKLVVM